MSLSLEAFSYKRKPSAFLISDSDEDDDGNSANKSIQIHDTESEDEVASENGAIEITDAEIEVDRDGFQNGDEAIEINDEEEDNESPVKMNKKKRKQIVIESDSECEEIAPTSKRVCFVSGDEDDEEEIAPPRSKRVRSLNDDSDEDCDNTKLEESIEESIDPRVISFLETCNVDDLVSVPGLSQARAEKINSMRPYAHEQDMIDKINSMKGFKFHQFYENCVQYLSELEGFEQLLIKCTELSNEVKQETLILAKDHDNLAIQKPSCVPTSLSLKDYQLVGLNWLAILHQKNLSAILADQMGLGKTIQALAFIGYLMENGQEGPHLIICPCSTLDNWLREFEKWIPDITHIVYSGNQDERRNLRQDILADKEYYAVIITTDVKSIKQLLKTQLSSREESRKYNMVLSTPRDRAFFKKMNFGYLIMDEAHMMKNMNTERYRHMMQINAGQKLLLTGTPLQNDVIELMSLLTFLMPDMFSQHCEAIKRVFFNKNLSKDMECSLTKDYVGKVKKILQPFILRRLKVDVLADMPSKTEEVCYCPLNTSQRKLYDSFIAKFSENESEFGKNSNAAGMALLMNLRKATNHPLLLRNLYTFEKLQQMAKLYVQYPIHMQCDVSYVLEDMQVMSDFELHNLCKKEPALRDYKLTNEVISDSGKLNCLNGLLSRLKEKGHRVLLFSQFVIVLDIIEAYLKIKNYPFVRFDGTIKGSERQGLIDQYNNNEEIFIFLLSTRAGGLGINLTSADTVILHDIDFNPYNDKQAEDRCHRVGQTRDVTVYKLIGQNTIEENMLKVGNQKLQLEKNLVGNQQEDENHRGVDTSHHVLEAVRKHVLQNKNEVIVVAS